MSVDLKITTQSQVGKVWANWKMSKKLLEKVCGSKSYHLDSIRETTGKYLWNWKLQHRANWQRSGQIGRCQQNSWKRSVDLGATTVEELGKVWATQKMLVLSTLPEKALLLHCHHQVAMATNRHFHCTVTIKRQQTGTFTALSLSNGNKQAISLHCHYQMAMATGTFIAVTIKWQQQQTGTFIALSPSNGNRHFHCTVTIKWQQTGTFITLSPSNGNKQALSLHRHHQTATATNRHFYCTVTTKQQQTGTFIALSPSNSNKQALSLHCHHQTARASTSVNSTAWSLLSKAIVLLTPQVTIIFHSNGSNYCMLWGRLHSFM